MVVFLLYFPKFILSVRTFFYIYCPSQYEKVATWIWGMNFGAPACLCVCERTKQTKSKALESSPMRNFMLLCLVFASSHFGRNFFLRLEIKASRNYFWPTQRTEQQHVLASPTPSSSLSFQFHSKISQIIYHCRTVLSRISYSLSSFIRLLFA